MRKQHFSIVLALTAATMAAPFAHAALSLYDVQYSTDPSGISPYHQTFNDVAGGIVTYNDGFRVYLQDPNYSTWSGICIKDWTGELASVQLGDWISFQDVYIEDHRGTTFLQYDRDPEDNPNLSFAVESTGNPVPAPIQLTVADLAAPTEDPTDYWLIENHNAEQYESMLITFENVTVGAKGLGKADDNYELVQNENVAWGTDFLNAPNYDPFYHPAIHTGATLDSITGIVEQYQKDGSSYGWDYYQLLTRSASDIVPEPATLALLALGLLTITRRKQS